MPIAVKKLKWSQIADDEWLAFAGKYEIGSISSTVHNAVYVDWYCNLPHEGWWANGLEVAKAELQEKWEKVVQEAIE